MRNRACIVEHSVVFEQFMSRVNSCEPRWVCCMYYLSYRQQFTHISSHVYTPWQGYLRPLHDVHQAYYRQSHNAILPWNFQIWFMSSLLIVIRSLSMGIQENCIMGLSSTHLICQGHYREEVTFLSLLLQTYLCQDHSVRVSWVWWTFASFSYCTVRPN